MFSVFNSFHANTVWISSGHVELAGNLSPEDATAAAAPAPTTDP